MPYIIFIIICILVWFFSLKVLLLVAAAFALYFLLTAKKRRARMMFSYIYALEASGEPFVILQHIYFEAALKFALEHGGKLPSGVLPQFAEHIDLPINIKGTNYMIGISLMPTGCTWMGIINMDEEKRKFREDLGLM